MYLMMTSSFKFNHFCGHTDVTPLFPPSSNPPSQSHPEDQEQTPPNSPDATEIFIPSLCPFCCSTTQQSHSQNRNPNDTSSPTLQPDLSSIPGGSGLLTLLINTPSYAYCPYTGSLSAPFHSPAWHWLPLRITSSPTLNPSDIAHLAQSEPPPTGEFWYLAWIPRPVGEVQLFEARDEGHGQGQGQRIPMTVVSTVWRQRGGGRRGAGPGRFAGLLSQTNAAVLASERAEWYD